MGGSKCVELSVLGTVGRCIEKLVGQYKQPAVVIMMILNCCIIGSLVAWQVHYVHMSHIAADIVDSLDCADFVQDMAAT